MNFFRLLHSLTLNLEDVFVVPLDEISKGEQCEMMGNFSAVMKMHYLKLNLLTEIFKKGRRDEQGLVWLLLWLLLYQS